MSRRTAGVLLVAVLGIGLVAGCGSGNNTSAPVTATESVPLLHSPKPKLFAPIYLNIVGPAWAELARFAAEASHWDGRVTDARSSSLTTLGKSRLQTRSSVLPCCVPTRSVVLV
jgi:hypothetical protein